MLQSTTYPLTPTCDGIHLRVNGDLEHSHLCDIAAVTVDHHQNTEHHTLYLATRRRNVDTIRNSLGNRFRDDTQLTSIVVNNLTEATAAIWRHGHVNTIIVDDLQHLGTFPGTGHDDHTARNWLQAVHTGDHDTIRHLTGIDTNAAPFTGDNTPTRGTFNGATLIVGVRLRRGNNEPVRRIMGGNPLVATATTISHLTVTDWDDKHAYATGTWLKTCARNPGTPVHLRRDIHHDHINPWTATP